jgi:hypothetical protein
MGGRAPTTRSWRHFLALPLPLVHHGGGRGHDGLAVLAGPLVKLVPVEVATKAAMLATSRGGGHDLDKVAII